MIEKINFDELVEQAMRTPGHTRMRPVIEKELLHYDILFALDKEGLLEQLTFQGGTSLRLCYGTQRYSEDLDFVGGYDFKTADLLAMKKCLEHYIGQRYGLEVFVKEPREMATQPKYQDLKVDRWQIGITTSPKRKDIPKQKIKIEVCNIPAYSKVPKTMLHNYDFLPDGYRDTIIITESLDEIMCDKLISLVDCQRYVRHRDIWDLRWLKQEGAKINHEFLIAKINDYSVKNYIEKLEDFSNRLEVIIQSKAFVDEISRFIPYDILERTLQKENFKIYLINEINELLGNVKNILI